MVVPMFGIAAGAGLLYLGAEGLVRGSVALARRLGLSPLVIGLTVVAFGTSMPELVVSVRAAWTGTGAIAAGNVVGSNIANVALILGVAALIRPLRVHAQVIRIELPLVLAASLLLVLLLRDDGLARWEGGLLFAGLVSYTVASLILARSESVAVRQAFAEGVSARARSPVLDGAFVVAGLAGLLGGARLLVDGAVGIAEGLGLPQAIIGLTVVAIGTSLPELATSALASWKGEGDLAVGNVLGSNLFNILGILGVAPLVAPLERAGMRAVDLAVMGLLALALLPMMRTGFTLSRAEGGALLAVYVGYLGILLH